MWNGEEVYFKRKDSSGWKAAGAVLGRDGKVVLVGYGGKQFQVDPSHSLKIGKMKSTKT